MFLISLKRDLIVLVEGFSRHKPEDRKSLRSSIIRKQEIVKKKLIYILKEKTVVSTTSDIWSVNQKSYLSLRFTFKPITIIRKSLIYWR